MGRDRATGTFEGTLTERAVTASARQDNSTGSVRLIFCHRAKKIVGRQRSSERRHRFEQIETAFAAR